MEKETIRQLRGLNALVADAVDASVTRTERIHRSIARYPYAVLTRIGPVAAPVRVVEYMETTITGTVYWSVRLVARVGGGVVSQVLERLDARAR
jgi:hypothetical protein